MEDLSDVRNKKGYTLHIHTWSCRLWSIKQIKYNHNTGQ
ncbi:unnamed protein product [Brassica oleracea var. botrytis]|uniref:Uncharacterized protein n=1 Tax=Brassica oleracea TaxID=3712 RepID=A0A3P6DLC5_BRAOL|nr:unnamed protein product [Brassica napus]VDD19889.1 unnamed protein product [Brassica oleracea]